MKLVGPTEAAVRFGVSTRTVQRWLREGRLPSVRVGGRLKLDLDQLGAEPGRTGRRLGRVLVANRGELVARIARTCRARGSRCLALVTPDQAGSWWARQADEVVPLNTGYLDGEQIVRAAVAAGADAIHPGYGFLAENPTFAEQVIEAGMAWIGPPPAAMRRLGDKASARQLARKLGVPTLPGYDGEEQSDARLVAEASGLGYPVLLKPSAGGGGMGMHVVRDASQAREALGRARREARAAFGDERLVIERYLEHPRHVEVQLLLDSHGGAVHLGERDCSLQRRHQKVIEEAPSPAVDAALRARLGEAAIRLAREAGYVGAGTAEFLLEEDGRFHFLELNARLQVEHPVTELVTGRDLVADQLAVAEGQSLGIEQAEIRLAGHAIEARLYAEDPWAGFLPVTGTVQALEWPTGPGVRTDAGVGPGDIVGTRYDPLMAKLIVHGRDRPEALGRLRSALRQTALRGLTTNVGFLRWLAALPDFGRGDARTDSIETHWQPGPIAVPEIYWQAAALELAEDLRAQHPRAGFRLNGPPVLRIRIGADER
ncbi:MAG: biotin carboxylase N-terminal domain-containing protein, partial [Candidatus Limnocylindrales bacterium]